MKKSFPMGHIERKVYLSSVSGVATTKTELISWFNKNVEDLDIYTTKSFQVKPNPGNREPVICETKSGDFGNSVGLRNPGMEKTLPELVQLKASGFDKWLNVSLSADNPQDFITLVKAFDDVADSVELNFSCPHAKKGFGASIGVDIDIAGEYVEKIHNATKDRKSLLFIKLTPNVDNIGEIAKRVVDMGADGITAINTVGPDLHIDPVSNTPILQNALGGKGGKSGRWVYSKALEAIKEIRRYIPDSIPIIGMGGVWSEKECFELIEAGADAVGIGSVLGHVRQPQWPLFFSALKKGAQDLLDGRECDFSSKKYVSDERQMEYREHVVEDISFHSEDTLLLTLSGEVKDFKAGEFVFLWLPGVGEKPFSLAKTSPLTFIIKKRGAFTSYIFSSLSKGDKIYIRGPYGAEVKTPKAKKALIICGGTGEAVALPLAVELQKEGTEMSFLVGTSVKGDKGILDKELSGFGSYKATSDNGKPGRVLSLLPEEIEKTGIDGAYYIIGPEIFMKIASSILKDKGIPTERIMLSMERNTMCGIGLCGECSCGGHLECQWGTFMSLAFLEKEGAI